MALTNLLKLDFKKTGEKVTQSLYSIYRTVGPEVEIDESSKRVKLRENFFFSNIVETYYEFKGYKVEKI